MTASNWNVFALVCLLGSSLSVATQLRGRCKACHLNVTDGNAPVLMVSGTVEGTGMALSAMLPGMALASRLGIDFAGDYFNIRMSLAAAKPHHHLLIETLPAALGLSDYEEVMKGDDRPDKRIVLYDQTVKVEGEYFKSREAEREKWKVQVEDELKQMARWYSKKGCLEASWTPNFLLALRSQAKDGLQSRVREFSVAQQKVPVIALHLRRGDVDEKAVSWYTPDGFYHSMLDRIAKLWPSASVHLWSEGEEDSFSSFKERGVNVHLNGDPIDALAHLSFATVFVSAKGSFSRYAMILNENCVIDTDPQHQVCRSGNWIEHDAPDLIENLTSCVKQLSI